MNRVEEKEAYLVLQCLWQDFSNNFYSSESPDLKNDIDNVGIEITQSTIDIKNRISYLSNKIKLKPNKASKPNLEIITFYDKDNLYEDYEHSDDMELHKQELTDEIIQKTKDIIATKIEKFNNNYSRYKTNGLFVFIRNYEIGQTSINDICQFFNTEQVDKTYKFDILFLHDIEQLYIYHFSNQKLEIIPIDDDTKNIIYNFL